MKIIMSEAEREQFRKWGSAGGKKVLEKYGVKHFKKIRPRRESEMRQDLPLTARKEAE